MALYTDQGAPCEVTPPGRNDSRRPDLLQRSTRSVAFLQHVCSVLPWSRSLATSSGSGGPLSGVTTPFCYSIFSPSVSAVNEPSLRGDNHWP